MRPEHLATVLLGLVLISSQPRRAELVAALRRRSSRVLMIFIAWTAIISLVRSPDLAASSRIVGWLALDAVIFVGVSSLRPADRVARQLIQWGTRCALLLGAGAIVLWSVASNGGPTIGEQQDRNYGGYAVFATTYEANVLAAVVVLWALVDTATAVGRRRVMDFAVAMIVPVAIVATHTRAAFGGLAIGLLILLFQPSARLRAVNLGAASLAVLVTVIKGPSFGAASTLLLGAIVWGMHRWCARRASRTGRQAAGSHTQSNPRRGPVQIVIATALIVVGIGAGFAVASTSDAGPASSIGAKFYQSTLSSGTGKVRFDQWTTALSDLHGPAILTGLGSNTYGVRHLDPTRPGQRGYLSNMWLAVVYDSGVVGLGLLLLFGVLLVISLPTGWRAAGLALGVSFSFLNVFTNSLWFSTTWLLAGLAGLGAASARGPQRANRSVDGTGSHEVTVSRSRRRLSRRSAR